MVKKTFYEQVLKLKLKMYYRTSAILNFGRSYGHLKIASLYGEYMDSGCIEKSNTNNLLTPTDLIER